jgi:hypothetical protein
MDGPLATGGDRWAPEQTLHAEAFSPARFMHPDGVVRDGQLTRTEKRELLSSWISDINAVPDAPGLRQLSNGAIVQVDDVLRALKLLDGVSEAQVTRLNYFDKHIVSRSRVKRPRYVGRRRGWFDDDDDPPPCPAAVRPNGGAPSGGEAGDLVLPVAA